jgi:CheY-like chemotaxis protein
VDRLERIAGRVARAVGAEQTPEEILESASLLTELASEVEAFQSQSEKPAEAPESLGAARTGRKTVLLAEADEAERKAIGEMLEALGHLVLEAETGAAAVEICLNHSGAIDALLTTLFLPDMTGSELADQTCSIRPGLRALYLSAYEIGDVLYYGLLTSHATMLIKPVTADALARKLADLFETEYAR